METHLNSYIAILSLPKQNQAPTTGGNVTKPLHRLVFALADSNTKYPSIHLASTQITFLFPFVQKTTFKIWDSRVPSRHLVGWLKSQNTGMFFNKKGFPIVGRNQSHTASHFQPSFFCYRYI